uniref:Ribonuclease H-like domain, reverse transcriptase, RNA-dependent DNA polymerase n=1 Tax=Tanacetum cinerariifolium TaxID=118510 RepID=A0A6L2N0U0_TANCI|nr:ribonuclease H-like domain, reverse transcriptase, RNA-dependent DNA polymerase [Tanacetum cinerariifolium]
MEEKLEMSDLGLLAYYLGIEVTQTNGDISIKQSAYASKILKEAGMIDCNETLIPMDPGTRLTKITERTMVNPTEYRSLIGCLRYLLHIRPDLSYYVGLLSHFMQEPKEQHMKAIRQVLRYVKRTKDHGITYKHNGGNKIHGYNDSSYGVNTQEGKGTTGIIFYYGESPISWSIQKQAIVALSSCESKFIAATAASTQALWLKRLLSKLTHTQEEKITIQVDNKSAIELMKNLVFHGRSKHIDTKQLLVADVVAPLKEKFIGLKYIQKLTKPATPYQAPPERERKRILSSFSLDSLLPLSRTTTSTTSLHRRPPPPPPAIAAASHCRLSPIVGHRPPSAAAHRQMQSMKDNEVWDLVDLPPKGKIIGSKWLFKKKTDMDGVVHIYKARLVAKGSTQTYWVDYQETFSSIADIRAIRILIAIAVFYDHEIWQMDVKTAFLSVKSYIEKCFAMKDLGETAYIFGIKIYRDRLRQLIGLCQSAYIEKILKRIYMENSKRESILMQEKLKLSKSQCASTPGKVKRMHNVPYASAVGSIIIQVNLASAVKNILKYLCNTKDMFLFTETGYVFVLNEGAVDWKSTKQSIFATSSAEAECIAASDASKHYRIEVHYLREVIEFGDVTIEKVHTDDNLADPFTKALPF